MSDALARPARRRRRVILNLHGLGRPPQALPEGEARYWVAPELLAAAIAAAAERAGRIETGFTFDDGNLSDLTIGAPMLAEAGHRATVFVLADRIGAPHYLSAEDIRALIAMGHRIGSHGAAHLDWTGCDDAGLRRELITARKVIETAAGQAVTEAAIPFGRYDARVLRALRAAGYARVYSSDGGPADACDWPVPRSSLTAGMTPADIAALIDGHEPLARRLRRRLAMAIKRRR